MIPMNEQEEKKYCCWCGEDLEYEQGREVWISNVDESYGHKWCVEKYDEKHKPDILKQFKSVFGAMEKVRIDTYGIKKELDWVKYELKQINQYEDSDERAIKEIEQMMHQLSERISEWKEEIEDKTGMEDIY